MFKLCESTGEKLRNPKKLHSIKQVRHACTRPVARAPVCWGLFSPLGAALQMLNVWMRQEEDVAVNGGKLLSFGFLPGRLSCLGAIATHLRQPHPAPCKEVGAAFARCIVGPSAKNAPGVALLTSFLFGRSGTGQPNVLCCWGGALADERWV